MKKKKIKNKYLHNIKHIYNKEISKIKIKFKIPKFLLQ